MIMSLLSKTQILLLDDAGIFSDLMRNFLAGIDSLIFGLISLVMNLLIDISQVRLDSNIIKTFSSRVFAILGILMFFKLAMSLLNIVVNPDSLKDKEKGTSKIVVRIIAMIGMLIMVNPIFDFAIYRLQPAVIETIPMIVLGTNQTLESTLHDGSEENSVATQIAATTFKAFVSKNEEKCSGDPNHTTFDETNTVKGVQDLVDKRCEKDHSVYAFNYTGLFSTVAGLIMIIILIIYTVDVAVRAIKLVILQLLAPIPIISYADPKTSQKSFSAWTKMCISAYIDLFIKLAIIYFVIFLLSELINSNGFVDANGQPVNTLVFIAIVIGIFVFASQAPAYICKIFGITPEKNGSFLGKALGVAGAGIGLAAGAGIGAITGGAGALSQEVQRNGWSGAKNAFLGGMAGGAAGGFKGGMKSANQFRNMANQKAQSITGISNLDTSARGRMTQRLSDFSKGADQRSNDLFDQNAFVARNHILYNGNDGYGYSAEIASEQQALHDSKMAEYDAQYSSYEKEAMNLMDSNYQPINDAAAIKLNELNKKMAEVKTKRQQEALKSQSANGLEEYRAEAEKRVIQKHKELKENVYIAARDRREENEKFKKETKKLGAAFKESGLADTLKK